MITIDPVKAAAVARVKAIDTAIANDSVIAQIKQMSNAEYDAYWAANVTNAAQLNAVVKRIVRIVVRRLPPP